MAKKQKSAKKESKKDSKKSSKKSGNGSGSTLTKGVATVYEAAKDVAGVLLAEAAKGAVAGAAGAAEHMVVGGNEPQTATKPLKKAAAPKTSAGTKHTLAAKKSPDASSAKKKSAKSDKGKDKKSVKKAEGKKKKK